VITCEVIEPILPHDKMDIASDHEAVEENEKY
jgi:hypothetical protein